MSKEEKKMGKVITFYSYKGGVGRSMALANAAVLLAKWNYKVLIIDWDLEAPGLENFYSKYLQVESAREKNGLIDILFHAIEQKESDDFWRTCVSSVKIEKFSVDFISSGKGGEEYYENVRSFDFKLFYEKNNGEYLVDRLRQQWKREYDFVLVDSRTGVTDIGGICTVQLPDILVALFTATHQGFDGIKKIALGAQLNRQRLRADRVNLLILPIAARIDNSEFDISKKWFEIFENGLEDIYYPWLPKSINRYDFIVATKIPYIPYFSFDEKLPVIEDNLADTAGIGYAYESITALIADNLNNPSLLIQNRSRLINAVSRRIDLTEINEHEISEIKRLFEAGSHYEAERELNSLLRKYPNNVELNNLKKIFTSEIKYKTEKDNREPVVERIRTRYWRQISVAVIYCLLFLITKFVIGSQSHSSTLAILLSLLLLFLEQIANSSTRIMAHLFVYRKTLSSIVLLTCICLSSYLFLFSHYDYLQLSTELGTILLAPASFLVTGMTFGVIFYLVVSMYFNSVIKAKNNLHIKMLMGACYIGFLTAFPWMHKSLSPFYVIGVGVGTVACSLYVRPRGNIYNRLKENLLLTVHSMKREYRFSSYESAAIELYARQQWSQLRRHLGEIEESEITFFIKLSMYKRLREYEKALVLLSEKEEEMPSWYAANKHYFKLHYSINQNEKQIGDNRKAINGLRESIKDNPNDVISVANLALYLVNDIDTITDKEAVREREKEALYLIWKAIKLSEGKETPKLISIVTGLSLDFSFTYIVDIYGYILFKNGHTKLPLLLLNSCVQRDPSYSSAYLHLAEVYLNDKENVEKRKSAEFNLHVAIITEKLFDKHRNGSYIMNKAQLLLDRMHQ